jgi:hypothetical protein
LVDSELKSGGSVDLAYDRLVNTYKCDKSDIWYAVLVICGISLENLEEVRKRPGGLTLENLLSKRAAGELEASVTCKPHYVAYCTPRKVEMPGRIF